MPLPPQVTLVDVGPRDGLQNEPQPVATDVKVELVRRLVAAGVRDLEITSFVSPKWVPQMADAAAVLQAVGRPPGVRTAVLVPNLKGWEGVAALPATARPDEVVIFGSASEAFSRRNLNCGIDESLDRFASVAAAARAAGLKVRGVLSCTLGCPYEGEVSPDAVERVVRRMRAIGADHIGIADTIGVGTPRRAQAVMERALRHFPIEEVSGHFHDTYGQALANIYACLEMGVRVFDASVAGLGGCPYARGATGNVATEDVVFLLRGLDIDCGIDLDALVDAAAWISGALGRKPVSRSANALLARRPPEPATA